MPVETMALGVLYSQLVLSIASLLSAQANTHSEPLGRLPEDKHTRGSSVSPATLCFDKQMADSPPPRISL